MTTPVIPDASLGARLAALLERTNPLATSWQLLLFVNDFTPTPATTLANLTEPSWTGYSRYTLARSGWGVPVVTTGCAVSTHGTSPYQFTQGGGPTQKVYGYALFDAVASRLELVVRLDTPDQLDVESGQTYSLQPRYTLTSAAC